MITDRVNLLCRHGNETLTSAGVVKPLPRDGHALRCGWDFQHHYAASLVLDDADSAQREVGDTSIEDLELERIQTLGLRTVGGPYDIAGLVAHAEDEPCCLGPGEVCLVA